jgi:hypothetical protein
MLKLHKDLPKAKTPRELESLKRAIAATGKQMSWCISCTADPELGLNRGRKAEEIDRRKVASPLFPRGFHAY